MILLAASGSSNTDIANNLGISRPVVNKIIKRFSSAGVQAALEDAARPGRPKELDPEQRDMDYFFGLRQAKRTS